MKANYHVALDVRTIRIGSGDTVLATVVSRAPRMKAVDAVFLVIVNQPVQWNCLSRTANGTMDNAVEMMAVD